MAGFPDISGDLERLWRKGLAAADPFEPTRAALPGPAASGRTLVIGAGKASARMAQACGIHYRQ